MVLLLSTTACEMRSAEVPARAQPEGAVTDTPSPESTEHLHIWENGVCMICGLSCTHHWEQGVCRICGLDCPHEHHDPNTGLCTACWMPAEHTYVNLVCTRCGECPGFLCAPADYPAAAGEGTERHGTLTAYHLSQLGGEILPGARNTRSATDRKMADFVVYTPFDYDPEGRYNVLILLPAAGHDAHRWLELTSPVSSAIGRVKGADLLDRLIAGGCTDPLIVVTVEYFLNSGPAQSAICFEQILRWYLLPFLAENYATYASVDEYGLLVPAPEHFALAGASYGAMIGWEMLPDCTDLFSYWGLLSGAFQEDTNLLARINEGVGESDPVRFLYAGDGRLAAGWSGYRNRVARAAETCGCFEEGKNILFLLTEQTDHSYFSWNLGLYNCLQIFFRNEYIPGTEPEAATAPDS